MAKSSIPQLAKYDLNADDRTAIEAQIIKELQWSRTYKQGKIKKWQLNEIMYYGRKLEPKDARSNVDLAQMQGYVHTLWSKMDNEMRFKYVKKEEAQFQRVKILNALLEQDKILNDWDIKDLAAKKQVIIYGRAAFTYAADSVDGYQANLENIDVYDLLVDPAGGGLDVERMFYWGRYGIIKTKEDLQDGMDSGEYIKDACKILIEGVGNATEWNQEETNKQGRMYDQRTIGKKQIQNDDKYKLWEWYTTYKGRRYYTLFQATGARFIKIVPLDEMFSPTKYFPKGAWPLITYAAFLDLTEFWTPSFCDYVRDNFMAENVTVNQLLDNGEAHNKPMKLVNVNAIENLAELKYRRDGMIRTKSNLPLGQIIQYLPVPEITTPTAVFNMLEKINEKNTGVTPNTKGVSDEDQTLGEFEGKQDNNEDRFKLFNKSLGFANKRFAKLYQIGVRDHLVKKTAIEMLGPDGIQVKNVKRADIFKGKEEFGISIEGDVEEAYLSYEEKKTKIEFLTKDEFSPNGATLLNPKKVFEIGARIMDFTEEDIKQLLDMSDWNNQETVSQAYADIADLLDDEDIEPYAAANNTYKQVLVDYLNENKREIDPKVAAKMIAYIQKLQPIIVKNLTRALVASKINMLQSGQAKPGGGNNGSAAPEEEAAPDNGGAEVPPLETANAGAGQ